MTHYIVTDFANPINVGSFHGSITPLELKVWPGWKRHSGVIATYVWKSKPRTKLSVPLKNDKTYTFDMIARLFNEQLNISAAGDPVATLSHKDGKVNLYVKDDTQLSNLKISEDIAKVLKIKGDTSNTGEPIEFDKIAFNNTKNVFLVCDQINSTLINNRDSNTVTVAACVDEIIPFEKPMRAFAATTINTSHSKSKTIKATTYLFEESSIDYYLINHECLSAARKTVPTDNTPNGTSRG